LPAHPSKADLGWGAAPAGAALYSRSGILGKVNEVCPRIFKQSAQC